MAVWCSLYVVLWDIFTVLVCLVQEKSGNPGYNWVQQIQQGTTKARRASFILQPAFYATTFVCTFYWTFFAVVGKTEC
jgi:hypothetical protein